MTALSGTVLLTGASGGIGRAIARAVAPPAGELILSGRRTEVLDPLAGEARCARARLRSVGSGGPGADG